MKSILLIFLFFISCSASFSQIKLDSGLVAYYPFNGNANDASGNGNNPEFNNATLTSDRLGNLNSAYNFNGINNYMQIPNSASLNMATQMSIALQVKPLGFYTGPCYNNMMIMKGDGDYLNGDYFIRFSDVITGCTTPTTADEQFYGTGVVASDPIVKLNQWYNVVWTSDGTTVRIYVDCVLQSSLPLTFTTFTNSFDLFIGRLNNSQFPYWLNADLDDIRIYNRALNVQEVNALCSSVLPLTLTKFETNVLNKQIKLNWNVENESGIQNFTVERSLTGHSDFVPLGTIAAKNIHAYSFVDNSAAINQNYYYRLSIVEKSGAVSYSEIKTATISAKNKLITIFPNPSNGNIAVRLNGYQGHAKFTISNTSGQTILERNELIIDNSPFSLKLTNQSKGIYWLKVSTDNNEFVEKILIY